MTTTRRDHYCGPSADEQSARVLDEALASLGTLRIPTGWLGDGGAEIQLLASLILEAQGRLPQAVALARDQEYSWAEIGDLLGTTRAAAWQRFAHRAAVAQKTTRRRELLANPD
jgi:hypothetical protein